MRKVCVVPITKYSKGNEWIGFVEEDGQFHAVELQGPSVTAAAKISNGGVLTFLGITAVGEDTIHVYVATDGTWDNGNSNWISWSKFVDKVVRKAPLALNDNPMTPETLAIARVIKDNLSF